MKTGTQIKHGKGKYIDHCEIYEGWWKDDVRCGSGRVITYRGESYDGEWKDCKYHGMGRIVKNVGDIYYGFFN